MPACPPALAACSPRRPGLRSRPPPPPSPPKKNHCPPKVMCDARNFGGELEAFQRLMNSVKRGDIVGITGADGRAARGAARGRACGRLRSQLVDAAVTPL